MSKASGTLHFVPNRRTCLRWRRTRDVPWCVKSPAHGEPHLHVCEVRVRPIGIVANALAYVRWITGRDTLKPMLSRNDCVSIWKFIASVWYLQWIEVTEQRKGSGTAVMRELIRATDRHSREITLKAASRRGAHSIEEPVAYYQRFGFMRLGGPSRVRVMITKDHLDDRSEINGRLRLLRPSGDCRSILASVDVYGITATQSMPGSAVLSLTGE
jgi:hypothetical protein